MEQEMELETGYGNSSEGVTSGDPMDESEENYLETLFKYYVEGVGILSVGSLGLIINIVALYILFRKKVRLFYSWTSAKRE